MFKRLWKDFAEFWKTQVFWAFLISAGAFFVQWRRGTFAGGKFRENVIDNLIPYGVIVALFITGNVARTLFVSERDQLKKKRRLTRREEYRAERKAELERLERDKPQPPKPNLQFRRVFAERISVGHPMSSTQYDAVLIEIGNELSDGEVGSAKNVRAHLTYLDSSKEKIQIRCPGFWVTHEDQVNIPPGESNFLAIAFNKGYWATDISPNVTLKSKVFVELRLLDNTSTLLAEVITIQLTVGNERFPAIKRVEAAS